MFNALQSNHAFLSQGCTRQRRSQMEPSSSPHHTWAGARSHAVPRGAHGAWIAWPQPCRELLARWRVSCQLSLTWQRPQQEGPSPLPHGHASGHLHPHCNASYIHGPLFTPLEALISFCTANSRYPALPTAVTQPCLQA